MKSNKIINEILMDMGTHPLIENGIVDFSNHNHIKVLTEKLVSMGMEQNDIDEVVDKLTEGKHPERQAYNKEGWLVTFPSPAYKQAAIQKGTHFGSDPTHGNGGMNVYYKKKGKQARIQQKPTQTEPGEQPVAGAVPPGSVASPKKPSTQQPSPPAPEDGQTPTGSSSELPQSGSPKTAPDSVEQPSKDSGNGSLPPSDTQGADKQSGKVSPSAPAPVAPPAPNFVNISVEFAKSKGWAPTPYGEWRTPTGEPSAIVALSGEVVPMQSNDRDELKLLANKKST